MKVSYCQNNPDFGEIQKNFNQVESLCKKLETDLLVLPELFASGYTFISSDEVKSLSEPVNGETSSFLVNLAKMTDSIVVAGFPERCGEKIYNSALIVNSKEILGTYRKIHLFNKEKIWFSPGDLGFKIWKFKEFTLGVMICFDWIFPEAARSLTLAGADIIAHPANLVLPYCQKAMVTRCIENNIYAITANRIGLESRGEDQFNFTGQSQITAPKGKILSSASVNNVEIGTNDIDPKISRFKSLNQFNHLLNDRKIEFYCDP